MMSGLVQIAAALRRRCPLIQETISAAMTASIIILAMSLGLIIPKMIVDYLGNRSAATKTMGAAEHVNSR